MPARLSWFAAGLVAALAAPIGDRAEARQARVPEPAPRRGPAPAGPGLRGTLVLNGCLARAQSIEVAADLVEGPDRDGLQERVGREQRPARALVGRGRDPHTFEFRFVNLEAGRLYRLSVGVPSDRCGRVFWRGPADGLVVAGGGTTRIEGFAARTRLEILSLPERSRSGVERPSWVGADDLQFTDPARSVRSLRWRSDLPGVTGGELQIAAAAFPTSGAFGACDEPAEGLVWRQAVAFRGDGWTTLPPMDFSQVLASRRAPGSAADRTEKRILNGAPLHMRIVPHAADGPLCDVQEAGVHGEVLVAKLPPAGTLPTEPPGPTPVLTAANDQVYNPAYLPPPDARGHPTFGELAYLVTKDHQVPPVPCYTTPFGMAYAELDPLGCVWIHLGWAAPGATIAKGTWFYFRPNVSSSSGDPLSFFTDSLGPVVTALYHAAGIAVNLLANGVEDIKNAVADVAVDALTFAGMAPVCNALGDTGLATCEGLVKTGLEIGLTSMGLPPSVPNWDQLQADGIDYLKAQVAQEVAGNSELAQLVTDAMLTAVAEQAVAEMDAKRHQGAGPQFDWVIPYLGFTPASWTATVRWTGSAPLPTDDLFIERKASWLFEGANLSLPTNGLPDVDAMRIPMVLAPNFLGIANPLCRYPLAGDATCQPVPFLSEPACLYQTTTGGNSLPSWHTFPCNQNTIDIYYRDQWTTKMDATACSPLQASSYRWLTNQPGGLAISVPAPVPPFLDVALVSVPNAAIWNGPFHVAPACQ